jgi:hypothetical protein
LKAVLGPIEPLEDALVRFRARGLEEFRRVYLMISPLVIEWIFEELFSIPFEKVPEKVKEMFKKSEMVSMNEIIETVFRLCSLIKNLEDLSQV